MSIWDIFGLIAGICIAIFAIPQIISLIRTKDTSYIKLSMYVIYVIGCYVYVVVGILVSIDNHSIIKGLQLIIADGAASIVATIILTWKTRNLLRAHKLKITEVQYCASLKPKRSYE